MEEVKGFKYQVEGHRELDKFAKGILAMVNMKSSVKDTVLDVQTFEGCETVNIVSMVELDGYLEEHLGEITYKEECNIMVVGALSLGQGIGKKVDQYIDDEKDYFVKVEEM